MQMKDLKKEKELPRELDEFEKDVMNQSVNNLKLLLSRVYSNTDVVIESMPPFFNFIVRNDYDDDESLMSEIYWLDEKDMISIDQNHAEFINDIFEVNEHLDYLLLTSLVKYKNTEEIEKEFKESFIINLYKNNRGLSEFDMISVIIEMPIIINKELVFSNPKIINSVFKPNSDFKSNDDMEN